MQKQYTITDNGTDYAQAGVPAAPSGSGNHGGTITAAPMLVPQGKRGKFFYIPSIVKTAGVFVTGAVAIFSLELYGPENLRPSFAAGTYDARVSAAVKAAELQQQAKYEGWAARVKMAVEQQNKAFDAHNQLMIGYYQASYDRTRQMTQAALNLQSMYVSTRIGQVSAQQSTDQSIISLTRLAGRVLDAVEPGSGKPALDYANNLSGELATEMTNAIKAGVQVDITGWDTGLPQPEAMRAEFAKIKPVELPPMPKLGEPANTGSTKAGQ